MGGHICAPSKAEAGETDWGSHLGVRRLTGQKEQETILDAQGAKLEP